MKATTLGNCETEVLPESTTCELSRLPAGFLRPHWSNWGRTSGQGSASPKPCRHRAEDTALPMWAEPVPDLSLTESVQRFYLDALGLGRSTKRINQIATGIENVGYKLPIP